MLLKTDLLPRFSQMSAELLDARPTELLGNLTLTEAAIFLKGIVFDAERELHPTPEHAPLFFTRLEAAKILRCSPQKFDRLVKQKVIRKQYLGKKLVFSQEALSAAILDEKKKSFNYK